MKLKKYSLNGEATSVTVPSQLFGAEYNLELIAQAVRVYRSNQRQASAKTKTRGEVDRTTAKVYRQKHTGNARHGARSAPIYVGGGVAHGPRGEQNYSLTLSRRMARTALIYTLSAQADRQAVVLITGLEQLSGKAQEAVQLISKINPDNTSVLVVIDGSHANILRACRNIANVQLTRADRLNAWEVAQANTVIIMDEALPLLEKRLQTSTKEAK